MQQEIYLDAFFHFFKKRWWVMILTTILGLAFSYGYTTYLHVPQYRSSTQLLINQSNGEETNAQIMSTYVELVNTPAILREVQTKLDSPLSINELAENLNVTNPQNTQILNTTFTYSDPEAAAEIINTIVSSFQEKVGNLMNREEEILITYEAIPDFNPVSLSPISIMIVGSLTGLISGFGLISIQFLLSNDSSEENESKKIPFLSGKSPMVITNPLRQPRK